MINEEALPAEIIPDELLGAIFGLLKTRHNWIGFKAHNHILQNIFHKLFSEGDYPELSKHFVFSDAGPDPRSPALTEALSYLQLAGQIGRENPPFEVVTLKDTGPRYYEECLKDSLAQELREELERAADELTQELQPT